VKRSDFDTAVRRSDLPPPSRLVLMVLASLADWPGGVIPARFTPSLSTLADATGLSRSTVAEHLNGVEQRTWVDRKRPTVAAARGQKERTQYVLAVPAGCWVTADPASSPGDGLVREADQPSSPGDGPALVRELDWASPGAGHKPTTTSQPSSQPKKRSPKASNTTADDTAFDAFWTAYPHKVGKGNARRAWKTATQKASAEVITAGAHRYAADPTRSPNYTAHPTTWLNGERWADEPETKPDNVARLDDRRSHRAWTNPTDPAAAYGGQL